MKNISVLCFFLASALVTLGQGSQNKRDSTLEQFGLSLPCDENGMYMLPHDSGHVNITNNEDSTAFHLRVLDLGTQSLVNADIDIFFNSDFIKSDSGKTEYGEYNTYLDNFGWYLISMSSPGFFETSDTVWMISETRKTIEKDFYLAPIEVGMNITLNNIQFNFDKTSLSSESFAELDKEVILLNRNPSIIFEIGGHTDSDGPEDYNLLLSRGRAVTVVDYLISKGAAPEQLMARGYGETRPVEGNKTQSGKANNRRVELTVVAKRIDLFE